MSSHVSYGNASGNQSVLPASLTHPSLFFRYFPFDAQHCDLVIASWTYNGWELNVSNYAARGDTSNYVKSSEWTLVRTSPALRKQQNVHGGTDYFIEAKLCASVREVSTADTGQGLLEFFRVEKRLG